MAHLFNPGLGKEEATGSWSVELLRKGPLMYREFRVSTPHGHFFVEYYPRAMGCGTILVDGQIAQRRLCGWWSTPPLTFRLGPAQALLMIRVWPWLTIRALKLIVADRVL